MKIIKPLTLGVLHKPYRHRGGNHCAIAALGFFKLGQANERFLTENLQWPLVVPMLPPAQPLDDVMPKQYAEALLLGSAHAPGGKPAQAMRVRLCVGAIDKCLCVRGDRQRHRGLLGAARVSAATPFTSMPLDYTRAYGAPGYAANPVGRGRSRMLARSTALPNIEYPAAAQRRSPAGFGPLNIGWAPRKDKFGTYDSNWLKHQAPGFASDLDWSLFNMAPPDQWLNQPFQGAEPYRLEGMHPARAVIEGTLPDLRARAFLLKQGQRAEQAIEVALVLDTVWFLPEHELGLLVYHGQAPVDDSDALDIAALMVAYERLGEVKPLADYHRTMALRLDPATAALHAFDESQLAPAWLPATRASKAEVRAQEAAAALAGQQSLLDELDAEFWQAHGRPAPPGHAAPRAAPMPLGVVSAQTFAEGDFDLAGTIAQAKAQAQEVERQGQRALAALSQARPAAPAIVPAVEQAAALERAAVPAYDLFPALETGTDPRLSAMLAALERDHRNGKYPDPQAYQRARAACLQTNTLRRQARRAAPLPTPQALPLLAATAQALGRQALAWHRSGISLAGRDLAGADLRGADLSAADLREVMLEGALLAGASFAGADLRGAVLTGADLTDADFSGANLTEANLSASTGARVRFVSADLSKAQALSADWPGANLNGATLDRLLGMKLSLNGATLERVGARAAILLQAVADDSDWRGATLEKVVALDASLRRADFSESRLTKTVLIGADLQRSQWRRARWTGLQATGATNWRGAALTAVVAEYCGLHGGSLAGADLSGASFLRCDFGRADLRGAQLRGGLFSYSMFSQADLRDTVLDSADFYQAVCRKADLRGSTAMGASFAQAELSGALSGPADRSAA